MSEEVPVPLRYTPIIGQIKPAWQLFWHPNEPVHQKIFLLGGLFFWFLWLLFPDELLAPSLGYCAPLCFADDVLLLWGVLTIFIQTSPDWVRELARRGTMRAEPEDNPNDANGDDSEVVEGEFVVE